MGFFDFIKEAGAKILGKGDDNDNVKSYLNKNSKTMPIENLDVVVDGETVTIKGHAMSAEDRVKAALIAGNIEGVTKVNFEGMTVSEEKELQDLYYEIQKGDSLWKIADIYYKDGSRYPEIVAANLEVIKDADKIYAGQMIRIPNFVA